MKKTAFILLLVFFLPYLSNAETAVLKLRASNHAGFIRIVLEGPESVVSRGSASQKGGDIFVTFPDKNFSIRAEGAAVAYSKSGRDTVKITPGDFSGIKVFTLKDPSRLVIDAYMKGEKGAVPPVSSQTKEAGNALTRIKTVVIDPGHGGYENGIVKGGNIEKNTVMDISRKLAALVSVGPSRGLLTRDSDRYMALGERVNFANSRAADVFISFHIGNHRDIVIYTPVVTERPPDIVKPYLQNSGQAEYERETLTLLKALSEAVITDFGEDMLSINPIPYSIGSRIEAAALIIELPSYEYASYADEYNSMVANAIYKGLAIYDETRQE
jgi:N-acetylmuramoyl-L-alanine amidase